MVVLKLIVYVPICTKVVVVCSMYVYAFGTEKKEFLLCKKLHFAFE